MITSVFLLVILMIQGEPDAFLFRAPSMDLCIEAMKMVAKDAPQGTHVSCISMQEQGT